MKTWHKILITLLVLVAFYWLAAPSPVMYRDSGSHTLIGCKTSDTDWETVPISSDVCKELRDSRYETVWVAPGWRP